MKTAFVVPSTVRYELADGEWVVFKARLTYGEQQRLSGAALSEAKVVGTEGRVSLDFEHHSLLRLAIWLVDWSFCDASGKHVPVSIEAVGALYPEVAAEVEDALARHLEAIEAEKKVRSGLPAPGPR